MESLPTVPCSMQGTGNTTFKAQQSWSHYLLCHAVCRECGMRMQSIKKNCMIYVSRMQTSLTLVITEICCSMQYNAFIGTPCIYVTYYIYTAVESQNIFKLLHSCDGILQDYQMYPFSSLSRENKVSGVGQLPLVSFHQCCTQVCSEQGMAEQWLLMMITWLWTKLLQACMTTVHACSGEQCDMCQCGSIVESLSVQPTEIVHYSLWLIHRTGQFVNVL